MILALAERAFKLAAKAPVSGCIVEFGTFQGSGLAQLGHLAREYLGKVPQMYGFDTFEGIPESGVPLEHRLAVDYAAGQFGDTSLERVRERLAREGFLEVKLVASEFAALKPLNEYGVEKVRLAHLDGDLYESYRDSLRLLTPHLEVGSVVLCDESIPPNDWSMQSVREHGQRALREWEAASGFNLHLIRFEWTVGLYVIVDDDYLQKHWWLIDDLRKDTLRESLENVAKRILRRPLEQRPQRGGLRRPR